MHNYVDVHWCNESFQYSNAGNGQVNLILLMTNRQDALSRSNATKNIYLVFMGIHYFSNIHITTPQIE